MLHAIQVLVPSLNKMRPDSRRHLALVLNKDDNTIKFYIDGVLAATQSSEVRVCVFVCVCTHRYVCLCTHIFRTSMCVYVNIFFAMCVTHTHTHTYICIHVYTHTHTYTHSHTHTHTHTGAQRWGLDPWCARWRCGQAWLPHEYLTCLHRSRAPGSRREPIHGSRAGLIFLL